MDHSAPITLNANQGTRHAIKRCPPMRAVAKPSKPKLAPRSQKWPLGHRRGTMPRCATATVPTASHTSQAPISTTQDANSASAALHASPCAALRPRSSLLTYINITGISPSKLLSGCTPCLDEHCRQPFLMVSDGLLWSLVVSTKSNYYPTTYLPQLYTHTTAVHT